MDPEKTRSSSPFIGGPLAAALLAPAALSMLTTTFIGEKERAKAFAVYGAISGGGAAIGLLLGGVLTQYVDWRWCLLVNIPIAIIAVLGYRQVDLSAKVLNIIKGSGVTAFGFVGNEQYSEFGKAPNAK